MYISFESLEFRELCENKDYSRSMLGESVQKKFLGRLSDLMAAESVLDLPIGNPSPYGEPQDELYKIDIDKEKMLIFCPSQLNKTYLKDGNLDWSKITRIKLLKIEIPK